MSEICLQEIPRGNNIPSAISKLKAQILFLKYHCQLVFQVTGPRKAVSKKNKIKQNKTKQNKIPLPTKRKQQSLEI